MCHSVFTSIRGEACGATEQLTTCLVRDSLEEVLTVVYKTLFASFSSAEGLVSPCIWLLFFLHLQWVEVHQQAPPPR